MPQEVRAAWRTRFLFDDGAELRVLALVERAETLRQTGKPTTIRNLWIMLTDRVASEDSPDRLAAAGLTGMALGIGCN